MNLKDKIINILGQDYTITYKTEKEDPYLEENYGCCDSTRKIITIKDWEEEIGSLDKEISFKETIRHEIIHSFLSESGLQTCSRDAMDEEMVDWLSLQIPKIYKSCEKYMDKDYNGQIDISTEDINILGSIYTVEFKNEEDDEVLMGKEAYTDASVKKIILNNNLVKLQSIYDFDNPLYNINRYIRKEIIYLYIVESGLGMNVKWSRNDNLIEWMARQFPKMIKTMEEYL